MAVNPMAQLVVDQEAARKAAELEQKRKAGCSYIRVSYVGRDKPHALHGFQDRGVRPVYNAETGETEQRAEMSPDVTAVLFSLTPGGDSIADVLDTPYNRMAISRNEYLKVEDPVLAKEIEALINVPFKVEGDRLSQLRMEKERIDKELQELEAKKAAKPAVATVAPAAATPVVPPTQTTTVAATPPVNQSRGRRSTAIGGLVPTGGTSG